MTEETKAWLERFKEKHENDTDKEFEAWLNN